MALKSPEIPFKTSFREKLFCLTKRLVNLCNTFLKSGSKLGKNAENAILNYDQSVLYLSLRWVGICPKMLGKWPDRGLVKILWIFSKIFEWGAWVHSIIIIPTRGLAWRWCNFWRICLHTKYEACYILSYQFSRWNRGHELQFIILFHRTWINFLSRNNFLNYVVIRGIAFFVFDYFWQVYRQFILLLDCFWCMKIGTV